MKPYIVLLGALLSTNSFCQDTTATQGGGIKGFLASNKGFRVGVSIGPRLLPGSGGEVEVRYIDQSPSRDSLRAVLDIPAVKAVLAYQLYVEGEFNRVFLQAGLEGFFGKFHSHAPFIGIGVTPYRWKNWDVRLSARLTYGSGKYVLGDVENNSVYFQIGNTQIYDPYLRMIYRDRYVGVIPAIGLDKSIGKHWAVQASANLFVTVRHHTRVQFYGHNGDGKNSADDPGFSLKPTDDGTAEVDLDELDLDFIRDNEVIDKLPLYYTGLSFLAGVSYMF
ncbi:MAG: hypothetical protein ABI599_02090 [Flavobacteriales bacterium]